MGKLPVLRSLLFVPGDSLRKFEKAASGPADALILDLEDAVHASQKDAARGLVRQVLERPRGDQKLFVRVNAFDTKLTLGDLAAVMPGRPDGIVLPKCSSAAQVQRLHHYLDAFESAADQPVGRTMILPIVTETAASLFSLGDYAGASPRLLGMMWGAEDLAADIGAFQNTENGKYLGPYALARNLCLVGARAAGVMAIDTVFTDIHDLDALRVETLASRRDGFSAKALIHPSHVAVVNSAILPADEEVQWARRVVAAYEASSGSGVFSMDGKMIDKPHLAKAEKILNLCESTLQRT